MISVTSHLLLFIYYTESEGGREKERLTERHIERDTHRMLMFGKRFVYRFLKLAAVKHCKTPCLNKYLPSRDKSVNAVKSI